MTGAGSASPSPAPSPTQGLRTIVTVKSTPYCTALAQHFNSALVPMLANDRIFTAVDVQLDEMNDMFDHPDYVDRFIKLRTKLIAETGQLESSLRPIQQQIDQLREASALSTDPQAIQQMKDAASQLQDAYKHQFQLSTDLTGLAQSMMQYNIFAGNHPLGGWTPYENTLPEDEKNIKVYLHFDQQRTSIGTAENNAVDVAYDIAENRCTK
ncbi:MAG TPA: hypothetical protein VMH02_08585 [Verrucomicrobiae bacterium]|nr:hypothetical protein [Verrucomicrobiae bacterium]